MNASPPVPLFARYPQLAASLGRVPLVAARAPVEPLGLAGSRGVHVKRDDLLHPVFCGNKIRKLEFSLGEAVRVGARALLTSGTADSNHVVPVARYGRELGFEVTCVLIPCDPGPTCDANLSDLLDAGARVVHCGYRLLSAAGQVILGDESARLEARTGAPPFPIAFRGGGALHAIGYVNAALELADQIADGEVQEPAEVFVPAATLATAAGLVVGFKLAGIEAVVACVPAVEGSFTTEPQMRRLLARITDLLVERDPTAACPAMAGWEWRFHRSPPEVEHARRCAAAAGLRLDPKYSAKAFAALLHCATESRLPTALFWNTAASGRGDHE